MDIELGTYRSGLGFQRGGALLGLQAFWRLVLFLFERDKLGFFVVSRGGCAGVVFYRGKRRTEKAREGFEILRAAGILNFLFLLIRSLRENELGGRG
jgi:hypothetical protein